MAKAFVKGDKVGLIMSKFQAEVLTRLLYSHIVGGNVGRAALTDHQPAYGEDPVLTALFKAGVTPDTTQSFSGHVAINNKV